MRRFFELLEEEGICDIRISRARFNAFQIAAVVGDKARAKVFVKRAYAARKVLAGDDNPTAIELKNLAKQTVDYHLYGKGIDAITITGRLPRGYADRNLRTG